MYKESRASSGVTGGLLEQELLGKIDEKKYLQEARRHLTEKHHLPKPVLNEYERMVEYENVQYNFSRLLKEMVMSRENVNFIDYKTSLELVKACQPDGSSPERPRGFFGRSLFQKIKEELDKLGQYKLEYFSAVGSHLDTKHGVDAFFRVGDSSGKELAIATLDVTMNPNKSGGYKADSVALFPGGGLDPAEDREEYLVQVKNTFQELWGKIAANLK